MPFRVKVFNDKVFTVKEFAESYRSTLGRILSLRERAGGGTDLGRAVREASESLWWYLKREGVKGMIILFTDGTPTKGLRGEELRNLIRQVKRRTPVVGIGVGGEEVKELFEGTAVSVADASKLGIAFASVLENRLRRLLQIR